MELAAFNDYEREFLSRSSQLPGRINELMVHGTDADQATAELKEVERELLKAKQNLKDMEMEVRVLSEPTRGQLGGKVKTYRDSLDAVTVDLKKAQQKFQRSALMGSAGTGRPLDFDKSLDARARMQQNTDKLRGGTDLLNSAHVQLEETIGVGESTSY
jgi:multidrug resistance efflux pump